MSYPSIVSLHGTVRLNALERLVKVAVLVDRGGDVEGGLTAAVRDAVRAVGLTERHEVAPVADELLRRINVFLEDGR